MANNPFTYIDLQLIRSLWAKHPPRYIAMILNRPVVEVEKQIYHMDKTGVKLCKVPTIDIVRRKPADDQWMRKLKPDEVKAKLIEMEVTSTFMAETTLLRNVQLPPDVLVMMIRRGDEYLVPRGDTEIHLGDKLLFIRQEK